MTAVPPLHVRKMLRFGGHWRNYMVANSQSKLNWEQNIFTKLAPNDVIQNADETSRTSKVDYKICVHLNEKLPRCLKLPTARVKCVGTSGVYSGLHNLEPDITTWDPAKRTPLYIMRYGRDIGNSIFRKIQRVNYNFFYVMLTSSLSIMTLMDTCYFISILHGTALCKYGPGASLMFTR